MKYHSVLDLHTHTIVSGHAYCTPGDGEGGVGKKGWNCWESQSMHRRCRVLATSSILRI